MGERISKFHRDFSRKIEGTNNVHLAEPILINFADLFNTRSKA